MRYTFTFEPDGRLIARIDCNRGRGSWKSPGAPRIELGPLALTRAQCAPGSLHDQIVRHWPYFRSYVIENGHLFLAMMADGGIYELEPVAGDSGGTTVSLENTYWKLIEVGGSPVDALFRQREPHLILNSGTRRATGSGGCNGFGGTYEVRGSRLSFGEMVATMMACIEGMETERAFLGALERTSGWTIAGKELELSDSAGVVLARLDGRHMQ